MSTQDYFENIIILSICTQRYYGHHNISQKLKSTSGLSILLHGVISLPDATSYDKACLSMTLSETMKTVFLTIRPILYD